MMIRHRPYRRLLAIAAGLLILATGTPAYADDDGWRDPPCATGEITDHTVEQSANGAVIIHSDGWSAACTGVVTRAGFEFGLILYGESAGWVARQTDYARGLAPTPFRYAVNHTTERDQGPAVAICLAYDYHSRLSCLAVDASSDPPITTPISTEDERVKRKPLIGGLCGNCVIYPPQDEGSGLTAPTW